MLFTFDRIKDSDTKSPLFFYFNGVAVEKIDDKTVRFILEEPFAPFIESLTTGILPEHIWSQIPAQNTNLSEFNVKPIGTGPFKFKSLTKDNQTGQIRSIVVERNEDFFGQVAHIDKITFKFYVSFDEAIDALNNKKVEGISFLPQEKQDTVLNDRNLNFHLLNLPQYTAIFFNQGKNDVLEIDAVRKLISHAINKDAIVADILNAAAQKIEGPILPGTLGYSTDFPTYPYDVDYTKTQLEELGWELEDYLTDEEAEATEAAADDENLEAPTPSYPFQVRKKGDTYLEFTLTTIDQPEHVAIADLLKKDLQQVGIKLNLNVVSAESIQRDVIKTRDYEALLYGEIIGFDPDPYAFWHSSQSEHPGLNLAMFEDKDVDTLLEEARKTTDENIRTEKYLEFQQTIAEEVPAIFLFNPTYTYPQTKKINGFSTHTLIVPANRFSAINEWYIKTKRSFK
jgi:peptide/nickel transport system substrate-binding protein